MIKNIGRESSVMGLANCCPSCSVDVNCRMLRDENTFGGVAPIVSVEAEGATVTVDV